MVCFMICPWIFNGLDFNLCLTVWHFDVCLYTYMYVWCFLIISDYSGLFLRIAVLQSFLMFWQFRHLPTYLRSSPPNATYIGSALGAFPLESPGPPAKAGRLRWECIGSPKMCRPPPGSNSFQGKRWILWKGSITCCCDPWISFSSLGCMIEL